MRNRADWTDIAPTLAFPRTQWGTLEVLRVQRRTTEANRAVATFEERYQLACACGRKWWQTDYPKREKRSCGMCTRKKGPTVLQLLRDRLGTGTLRLWLDADIKRLSREVLKAAGEHRK